MMLSIITISKNNLSGLENTIQSIDYPASIQHIIIDGASTDGTVPYLKTICSNQLSWISEPDKGLYDAMNKGLQRAQGFYVVFMNAGDQFYSKNTLHEIIGILKSDNPDILYGDAMYIRGNGEMLGLRSQITTRHLPTALHWTDMREGMLVCHQSFIVRTSIAPNYIDNNLSADIDWQIKCLKKANHIKYYDLPICQYLIGGISQRRKFKSLMDRFKVFQRHFGLVKSCWFHLLICKRAIAHRLNY